MPAIPTTTDPTLAAIDTVIEQAGNSSKPRPYLGASQIGQPCNRALWYSFRWALSRTIPAAGLRRIQDGFRGEKVMIDWLRKVPGVDLWTEDETGGQIGIADCAGHFRGHLDGVIQGILQAPKTPHVWEHKVCNEAKVNKLKKLKLEKGEKAALQEWDEVYYAQAQVYMRGVELTRHYLTVATPGCRDVVSCRTAYDKKAADSIIKRAETIITAERPPLKISDRPDWWQCKFCDYHSLCHGPALPQVNCRTCAHSTATLDGHAAWQCEHHHQPIEVSAQTAACQNHVWHPDLLANHAEPIGANPQTGSITFKRKDGTTVEIGMNGTSTRQMLAESAPVTAPQADDVLTEIAVAMELPEQQIIAGELAETDFPKLTQAVTGFWDRWNHDEGRLARLRNLIDVIDGAYYRLMERGHAA